MPTAPIDAKTILDVDPWLEHNTAHIVHRHDLFRQWKDTIDSVEGGYDQFTKGYLKFGLNVSPDGTVTYREWAPNAKEAVLIGDFSKPSDVFFRHVTYMYCRQVEQNFSSYDQERIWRLGDYVTASGRQMRHSSRLEDQGALLCYNRYIVAPYHRT